MEMSLRIVTENKLIFVSLSLFYKHFSLRASIESIFVHQTSLFSFSVKSENFSVLGEGG